MRDLGGLALVAAAPFIARFTSDKGDGKSHLADMRELALLRPEDPDDYTYASVYRIFGWGTWLLATVLVYALASVARKPLAPITAVLEGIMIVAVSIGMFAGGMMLMSAVRQLWCRMLEGEINTRTMWTKDRPVPPENPGLLVRSCLPTNLDVVPALLFAYAFVPLLLPE
jgi:hypothetical protein